MVEPDLELAIGEPLRGFPLRTPTLAKLALQPGQTPLRLGELLVGSARTGSLRRALQLESAIGERRLRRDRWQLYIRGDGDQVQRRRRGRRAPRVPRPLDEERPCGRLGVIGPVERRQNRAGDRALAPDRDLPKGPAHERRKRVEIELAHMERVVRPARVRVRPTVGRRDDQQPVRFEHPGYLLEHALLLVDVLDHLKGDHSPERAIGKPREVGRVRDLEVDLVAAVVQSAVLDRPFVDVDTRHMLRRVGEQRGPKAFAAGEVQDASVADQRGRPHVPVEVLIDDLDVGRPRYAPLPRPLDQPRRARATAAGQASSFVLGGLPMMVTGFNWRIAARRPYRSTPLGPGSFAGGPRVARSARAAL